MSDAVIKIGAVVDKAAIDQGMTEGAGIVNAATVKMSMSFTDLQGRAKTSWRIISDDTKAAAATVSTESLRIAQATQVAANAQKELRAATALTRNAAVDQTEATAVQAAALDRLRTAYIDLAASQKLVQETSHKAVTDIQATSAAVRSFEGNPGIRSMEVFVGKTLGLGPAMQAIFPLVGAIAFGSVLFSLGEKVYELDRKAVNAAHNIGEAFSAIHDKALVTNDDLRIQSDRLADEIAKLSGHPGNSLQTAIDESIKRADQLLVSLRADRKEVEAIFKEQSVSGLGSMLTSLHGANVAGTGEQEKNLKRDSQALIDTIEEATEARNVAIAKDGSVVGQKSAADAYNRAVHAAFGEKISVYRLEAKRLAEEQAESERQAAMAANMGKDGGGLAEKIDNSAKIQELKELTRQLQGRQTDFGLNETIAGQQATVGGLKKDKSGVGEQKKADEERFAQAEAELARLKTLGVVSESEELAYWRSVEGTFKAGSAKYRSVVEKEGSLTQAVLRKFHEQVEAIKRKDRDTKDEGFLALEKAQEGMARWAAVTQEDLARTGERWDSYNRAVAHGAEITTQIASTLALANLKVLETNGGISALSAAHQLAAIHTQEHIDKLKALKKVLEDLKAEGAQLTPGVKGYEENQTRQQDAKNAISQEQGASGKEAGQDKANIANAIAKPYLAAFSAIDSGWLRVQNDLIQGNKNISRDFAQMGLSLVQSAARAAEQSLAHFVQGQIRQLAAKVATTQAGVATDAAGEAQSGAISAIGALKKQAHAAAVAAGRAWSAFADIPIVGPELGAIAAAATYAGVMSLAAFEKGGVVKGGPGMAVPILAHGGERVLTASQTNTFERMVNNTTTTGGGSTTINLGGNHSYSGAGSSDFRGQMREHRMEMAKTIKGLVREGHL